MSKISIATGIILNNMYRVLKPLGKGAMGNVYLVRRLNDSIELVVKELRFVSESGLDPDAAREIFFREAEFISRFNHPGLPKTYGVFVQDGHYYLTLEYIRGRTLEEIINSSLNPIETGKAVGWTIDIAEILDYLHNSFDAPLVYRDLKPANIMITPEDRPRLIDFGISRYYNPDKNTDTFRLGSPGYAAPEQYKGRGQSSPQTDVFALGVILFQMLTGYDPSVTPFKFPPWETLNPSIPEELEDIVNRAIQQEPLNRYISISEFREHLEKYKENYKKNMSSSGLYSLHSYKSQKPSPASPVSPLHRVTQKIKESRSPSPTQGASQLQPLSSSTSARLITLSPVAVIPKPSDTWLNFIYILGFIFIIVMLITMGVIYNTKEEATTIKPVPPLLPEMVFIEGGTYVRGSNTMGRERWEQPEHEVRVSSFYIAKYEVTNKEFCVFLNSTVNLNKGIPYYILIYSCKITEDMITKLKKDISQDKIEILRSLKNKEFSRKELHYSLTVSGFTEKEIHMVANHGAYSFSGISIDKEKYCFQVDDGYEDLPVVYVKWDRAVAYCNWLSKCEGLTPCYGKSGNLDISASGYRLPTEGEWEYACRGGTETLYYWGNEMNGDYCWYTENSDWMPHKVGQKKPNSYGLYDMIGNVGEWCTDWYCDYTDRPLVDPAGDPKGEFKVIRGGAFYGETPSSIYREACAPYSMPGDTGFRLVKRP